MNPTKTARATSESWTDEGPMPLKGRDMDVARILRAAFATLDLERDLDPSVAAEIASLTAWLDASRRVIEELGFGDAER
jgi:hypothetical protein